MADLLIATTNAGKIREIVPILRGTSIFRSADAGRLLTLADLPDPPPEPEETGRSFAENARLKASYYARKTGIVTVAEDSGLVIDALGGRPGIHSARYPGETYPDKFANLYTELAPVPRPWKARYFCALHLANPTVITAQSHNDFSCSGIVLGEISPEPRGTNGFGYDPIFFYPEFNATFGEIDDARKSEVAHRGKAFRKLREYLVLHPL
jgi:XTP/dITP diphosphohydrolase